MSVQNPSISNAFGIICDAAKDCGKLRAGTDPDGEFLAEWKRRLNKLINYFMTQGLKLFLIQDTALTLVPPISSLVGVALYTFGPTGTVVMPQPLRVLSGYYLYNTGDQYPLTPMSYPDEYTRLSNLLQPSTISSYAVNKQPFTLNVYLWNPPDAFTCSNGTVHLLLEVPVTNFISLTDQMMFPIEWALALEWGLAEQGSTGQPPLVQAKCTALAEKYRLALEDWDVEDADTMMQPDQRMTQYVGKFR